MKPSQNFLAAKTVAKTIAETIPLKGKRVLEIGAGKGALTTELAKRAKSVRAIEVDEKLFPSLLAAVEKFSNVDCVRADARQSSFNGFDAVFGNLPYHLSSELLFKLLNSDFKQAVFLLQKEFAERVVAEPGSSGWSRLSVMAQARSHPSLQGFVPRTCFDPVPRVDSAILLLEARSEPLPVDEELVRLLFQHKNQSVKKAFGHSHKALGVSKSDARSFAEKLPFSARRVRTLSLEELVLLSNP
jgi:16S rRNA (adenine1518-N6/adenine1519-N6)-dimethyltransferase